VRSEGVFRHQVTGGVPQGSVLGLLLWNTMYDGILRLSLVGRSEIVGFADDVALLVVNPGKAEERCNQNIRVIEHWLSSMGLELTPEKTEATVEVGSTTVSSSRAIKYLVMIDTRLSFREDLAYARSKAAVVNWALSTIMLNTRDPKQARSRRLLTSVTRATMLYAASVWAKALGTESYAYVSAAPSEQCPTRRHW